jgi:pimeloyl-ACP methyl ester carboxylesterase
MCRKRKSTCSTVGTSVAGALAEIATRTLRDEFRSIRPEEAQILILDGSSRVLSAYPEELSAEAEREYPKLIHYNKLDKGGHFAAWEQPQLFSEEVRAGFRPLRK